MIIVGIDFGDARTGISVCDKYEMMAAEAGCVHADSYKKALAAVGEKVVELKAELIVVGNPINMDGTRGPRSEKAQSMRQLLEETTGLPVMLWDERRTTIDAHNILFQNGQNAKKRKKTVDAVAAALMLEGYLTRRRLEGAK